MSQVRRDTEKLNTGKKETICSGDARRSIASLTVRFPQPEGYIDKKEGISGAWVSSDGAQGVRRRTQWSVRPLTTPWLSRPLKLQDIKSWCILSWKQGPIIVDLQTDDHAQPFVSETHKLAYFLIQKASGVCLYEIHSTHLQHRYLDDTMHRASLYRFGSCVVPISDNSNITGALPCYMRPSASPASSMRVFLEHEKKYTCSPFLVVSPLVKRPLYASDSVRTPVLII